MREREDIALRPHTSKIYKRQRLTILLSHMLFYKHNHILMYKKIIKHSNKKTEHHAFLNVRKKRICPKMHPRDIWLKRQRNHCVSTSVVLANYMHT